MSEIFLNTILYGVAGTGKTYNTVIYAVAIIEDKSIEEISTQPYEDILKRFNQYKANNLIDSITFHQSYSYEDFIEGIKPTLNNEDISYTLRDGIFKKFCKVQNAWNFLIGKDISSKGAKKLLYIVDNISNNNINIKKFKLGTNQPFKMVSIPLDMVNSIVLAIKNNFITIQDLKLDITNISEYINYDENIIKIYRDVIINLVEIVLLNIGNRISNKNRVFIIDEINRGNISKIFGELITLIEPSKRIGNLEQLKITLPYSQESFGIPKNIYILGTMNSSDHSTVSLDIALRRRFNFIEISPNYDLFNNIIVDGVSIPNMFKNINLRIEYLLGKDFLIGHTYFLDLITFPDLKTLSNIFRYTIVPLLCEYFYDDLEKVHLVLADNQTDVDDYQFIVKKTYNMNLFKNMDLYLNPIFEINPKAFENIESYLKI